jgi:hypothetical protein
MTNPYIAHLRAAGSHDTFYIHRELRRYELASKRFRDCGLYAYAELFDGYAEQTRLEIEALAQVDDRIAAFDANPFANAEFAPVREPAKVRS